MINKLLKYQEVDKELKVIEDGLKQSPEFKKYAQSVKFLKTVSASCDSIEERSQALLSVFNDLNAKLEKLLEEKNEFEQSDTAPDEDSVRFLKKKSNELAKRFATLEADLNKLSKEMNELKAQYAKLAENTRVMKAQRDEFKAKYEELAAAKAKERTEIDAKLKELSKGIDPVIFEKYLEKRKDNKFPIVFEVKNDFCSSCGTELSKSAIDLLKTKKIIECENCRRLIFLKN